MQNNIKITEKTLVNLKRASVCMRSIFYFILSLIAIFIGMVLYFLYNGRELHKILSFLYFQKSIENFIITLVILFIIISALLLHRRLVATTRLIQQINADNFASFMNRGVNQNIFLLIMQVFVLIVGIVLVMLKL